MNNRILRDYQHEARDKTLSMNQTGMMSGLIVLATGLGKTVIAADIVRAPIFNRTIFLTHREELLNQSAEVIGKEVFGELWNANVGIVKAERFDISKKLTVASVQTLHRRLDKIPTNHFDLVISDEAHLSGSASWTKCLKYFTPKLSLGLTATPHRLDGISLGDNFEQIIIDKDISFGINEGYLVELDGVQVRTSIDLNKVRTTGGELNAGDLEKMINTPQRNNLIADKWLEYTLGQTTLGFCVDIKHTVDITKTFQNRGIKASFVCADQSICPDRKYRVDAFKAGDVDVMFNCEILTTGFDYPAISSVIMARPTKSLTLYLQSIGRATRPIVPLHTLVTKEERIAAIQVSSKPKTTILDIVDITGHHSLVNTWSLDKDKPTADKVFKTREFKQMVAEKAGREAKITHKLEEDKKVVLLALPKVVINHSGAMLEPATAPQLKWIADAGYDTVNMVFTKADASEIISMLPATDAQVYILRKAGYDISGGVNRGQAGIVIKEIEAKKQRDLEAKYTQVLPFNDLD